MPASVLERDILPARVQGYQPRLLDELLASGEVVWVGAGSLGRDDGRVVLWRADRVALAGPTSSPARTLRWTRPGAARQRPGPHRCGRDPTPGRPPASGEEEWLRAAIVGQLEARGASFYREILAAVLRAAAERGRATARPARAARRAVGPGVGRAP